MCFFESLIREFLTQLAIWFVVFLRSEMFSGRFLTCSVFLEVFAFTIFFQALEVA
jgi:hypothetical protein